jgi:FkbM family methyltransferase
MKKSFEITTTPYGNYLVNEYDLIGNYILRAKTWEPHLVEFYHSIIDKEDICIDAGANLGFHAVQFGYRCKKVYAFEPQLLVFNQLCSNILFNDLNEIIIPFRKGLGNKEETKQMWSIEKEDFGNEIYNWGGRGLEFESSFHKSEEGEYREEDQVELITLDSLNIPYCNLIKIDIQGYEYFAFQGAQKLVNDNKPIILLESAPSRSEFDVKVLEYLQELGYENYRYYINTNEDCILVHPEDKKYDKVIAQINQLKEKYNIKKDF